MADQRSDDSHGDPRSRAGLPGPAEWERWTKEARLRPGALEGTYGQLKAELFNQPRVYHTKDWKWKGGPQNFGKKIINPQAAQGRAVHRVSHRCLRARRLWSESTGHMNSRDVFYATRRARATTSTTPSGMNGTPGMRSSRPRTAAFTSTSATTRTASIVLIMKSRSRCSSSCT